MTTFVFNKRLDLTYPGKCAFKTVDVQLWLLRVNVSTDRKKILEYRISKLLIIKIS